MLELLYHTGAITAMVYRIEYPGNSSVLAIVPSARRYSPAMPSRMRVYCVSSNVTGPAVARGPVLTVSCHPPGPAPRWTPAGG